MKVEIAGKAERFRAYANAEAKSKPRVEDHLRRGAEGKPAFKPTDRVIHTVEQVVAEGSVSGASFSIKGIGKGALTRVVFYSGKPESEVVVGSVDNPSVDDEVAFV